MKKIQRQAKAAVRQRKPSGKRSTSNAQPSPSETAERAEAVRQLIRPTSKVGKRRPPQRTAPKAPAPTRALSARQEKFCALYASGKTATEAYRESYGNTKTAEAASSRLLTNVKVRARVTALQQATALSAVLTLAEKRAFLRSVVLTPLGDIDERSILCQSAEYVTNGGVRGKLRKGHASGGNEETEPETTTVKLKMCDKLRAIELDAKLAGELREQVVHKVSLDEELADLIASIRAGA